MNDQDRDWLDDRLAAGNYIPDDGFTSKVLAELPGNARKIEAQRRWILAGAFAVAAGVAISMTIADAGNWALAFSRLLSGIFQAGNVAHFTALLEQPTGLLGLAAVAATLTAASIPFLRRWS